MQDQDFLNIGQKLEVISLKREPDVAYFSYVKDLNLKEMLIDIPSRQGKTPQIYVSDVIELKITTQQAIYQGKSIVIRNQLHPITGMWIRRPSKFERVQRRAFLRVPIRLGLKILMIDKDGDTLNIPSETRDLSGGGVSFFTNEDLTQYESIGNFFVAFKIKDIDKPFKTQCRLAFCREITHPPSADSNNIKYNFLAAFEFLGFDEKERDDLCRFCFNHQLDLKRKGLL